MSSSSTSLFPRVPSRKSTTPLLLNDLISKFPINVSLDRASPSSKRPRAALVSVERCGVYDEEGYGTMTRDGPRNAVYAEAIRRAVASGFRSFLEIGCGADACLTRMVLAQAGTSVHALEANPASAAAAHTTLVGANINTSRFNITPHISTATELDHFFMSARADGSIDAILQEVLGFVASREGIVPIFQNLQSRLGIETAAKRATIPSHCATFFTPTHVSIKDVRHNLIHKGSLLASAGGTKISTGEIGDGGGQVKVASAPFVLVSRLPLRDTACFRLSEDLSAGAGAGAGAGANARVGAGANARVGASARNPHCGVLEFLDLTQDLNPQLIQERSAIFTAPAFPASGTIMNSISCFVWAACVPALAPASRDGSGPQASASAPPSEADARPDARPAARLAARLATGLLTPPRTPTRSQGPLYGGAGCCGTAFPYGVEGLPRLPPATLSFSAASTDVVSATNWPDLCVLLERDVHLAPGAQVEVASRADLSIAPHVYQWRLRTRGAPLPDESSFSPSESSFSPSGAKRARGDNDWTEWGPYLSLDSSDGIYCAVSG